MILQIMRASSRFGRAGQRGVVLLALFIVLFMTGASLFLVALNSNSVRNQVDVDTMSAMREAKERLIAYAALYGDYYGATGAGPGHLPCPDSDGNGGEDAPCAANGLGRLPTGIILPSGNRLVFTDFRSGVDQQFWYAVASAFRRSPAGTVNASVSGGLSLDGNSGFAAILIAPGEALPEQNRSGNSASAYLEAGNVSETSFDSFNAANPGNFNDRVIGISAQEVLTPVTARVAETIKAQLDTYHGSNGFYPPDAASFATALSAAPAWFANNGWTANTTYTRIDANSASLVFSGCGITYTVAQATAGVGRNGSEC